MDDVHIEMVEDIPNTSQLLTIFTGIPQLFIVLQIAVHEEDNVDPEFIFIHPQDTETAQDVCVQEAHEIWARNAAIETSSP